MFLTEKPNWAVIKHNVMMHFVNSIVRTRDDIRYMDSSDDPDESIVLLLRVLE